jgi:RNA polymerase sigma-70 factor, ECF subfamily
VGRLETMSGTTSDRAAAERAHSRDAEVRRLVARAQRGERAALEALYVGHVDRIYAYLAATVGNRHDAEDLTVQTFLRMLESIGRFEQRSTPFEAWLFRIARNLAVDHFRRVRRVEPTATPPDPPPAPSAEELALSKLDHRGLLVHLRTLPRPQRQVLGLKFLLSLSNAEAAAALEKSEGAVKALQHRALESLHRYATAVA